MPQREGQHGLTFFLLAAFFVLFVLFLYGPLFSIVVLSFQGPNGGLTFPMNGISLHWFRALLGEPRGGTFGGPLRRSLILAAIVTVITVVISTSVGMAYRRRFRGATALLYLTIASMVVPSILVSLGIGLLFDRLHLSTAWFSSGLGAQLTWTLPFGFLIMLSVFNRFDPSYEEAARDLGASDARAFWEVVLPIILPSIIGVGLLGFTLSYDEIARSQLAIGNANTLPLEIFGMTTNVTTPTLYALGTLTTAFSFAVIGAFLIVTGTLQRRQHRRRGQARAAQDGSTVIGG